MVVTTGLWPQIHSAEWETLEKILRTLPYITHDDDYVICEREDAPGDYMQARPELEDIFRVEYRDSQRQQHFMIHNASLEETLALFESFFRQDGRWPDLAQWKDISHCFSWSDGDSEEDD